MLNAAEVPSEHWCRLMPSASERYAAMKKRQKVQASDLARFAATIPFALDPFQLDACRSLESGAGVLVAAPTGSGKTIVGEFAVERAIGQGARAFYTTPIKALSNQKFQELTARYGPNRVGLLTGDNAINGDAEVVVMTTEVLRNMIYESPAKLDGLSVVVMDEVHYLADRARGAVWEEVLIQLPQTVQVVALSATVSNAEEFGDWLGTVRGRMDVIVEEHRPVPLYQHVATRGHLFDLFVDDGRINPELVRLASIERSEQRRSAHRGRGGRHRGRGWTRLTPGRIEVLDQLDDDQLLPAIVFIFSRAGCDAAAEGAAAAGTRLTTAEEAEDIRRIAESRCGHLPADDLAVLGFPSWVEMLSRGIAAHHAGMLPVFKEVVEELFAQGLIKVVYATETLALGINMPARSVVLEKLSKWNGETHADITAGEYTQLTGRAGRRGIDVEGHAVVMWYDGFDPEVLAGLAATRTYPLRSSFRPSYNMAVNLVGNLGFTRAREVLETSFAQFQADRAVVGLATQLRRLQEAAAGYAESMQCHLGDFAEYAALRAQISDREKQLSSSRHRATRNQVVDSLTSLRRGDIIAIPAGRRAGLAVIVDPDNKGEQEPRPSVVTVDRQFRRLAASDFQAPVVALDRMRIPKSFQPRKPASRRDLALALRRHTEGLQWRPARNKARSDAHHDDELVALRAQLRQHPCHGCAEREDHARWATRYQRLQGDIARLEGQVSGRTNSIARQFDHVCDLLAELGYLSESGPAARVTDTGRRLARIYNDSDLVVAESLRLGAWDHLNPAQLAAVVSALVFEGRNVEDQRAPEPPDSAVAQALTEQSHLLSELKSLEREHRIRYLGDVDPGFARACYQWVKGASLEKSLRHADLAPGDFVRWCKQVADLLDQISDSAGGKPAGKTARKAATAIRRGVVTYS
jgi:ATP-dependent RNA helicase HelY